MLILDPARVAPVPWPNGAGVARELAHVVDSEGRSLWRIAVADLTQDAPFSTFAGIDRLFVALGPLRLTIDDAIVDLQPGQQVRFPGEAVVGVSLLNPTRALNVMTRRGACSADVRVRQHDEPPAGPATATVDLGDCAADIVVDIVEVGGR